jgi:hypothetical protein
LRHVAHMEERELHFIEIWSGLYSTRLGYGPVIGSCDCEDETTGSIEGIVLLNFIHRLVSVCVCAPR